MNVIVNICIYLFQLAGAYFISGNPDDVVIGDNVTVTLTCVVDDNNTFVTWTKCGINIASMKYECELANGANPTYT
jgi:hypothetical protein